MELKNLRTFQTVVDQGSYQKAAERLLECGKTGSVPTGTLRVDMAETLLCYQMQPVIRAFRERAPQVRLIVRSCNCMQIPQGVRTGACDLGVGYDMDWNREALEVESMGSYDIVLLASPDFTEPDFTTPGQRKAASLVTDEPDSIFRRRLEAYLCRREIELDVTLELWSIETIKRCVMSNLGFTYLPRFVAEEELADGRLVELEAPISGVPAPALCAWRKGRWVTPAMELFLSLLREALAEGEPLSAAASAPALGPFSGRACRLK
jgi:DNA-binding transcriptional LysR family regulator